MGDEEERTSCGTETAFKVYRLMCGTQDARVRHYALMLTQRAAKLEPMLYRCDLVLLWLMHFIIGSISCTAVCRVGQHLAPELCCGCSCAQLCGPSHSCFPHVSYDVDNAFHTATQS